MDTFAVFDVSAAGMNLERLRLEVSAVNLANAHTTQAADGTIYRPLRVTAQPSAALFESMLLGGGMLPVGKDVHLAEVRPVDLPPRRVYDPGNPQADNQGFVAYPDVNPVSEMVQLISVTRAYEANVRAMNAAKTMAMKALEIGSER